MCVLLGVYTLYTCTCVLFFGGGGGGQTNIFRNRGGRRLQLKCIKFKLAKVRGGGGGNVTPQPP